MKFRLLILATFLGCALLPLRAPASTTISYSAIQSQRIVAGGSGRTSASVDIAGAPEGSSYASATIGFRDAPACDPWDRLFAVDIDGIEVLRGTTPRTAFTVNADVTPYLQLLPGTHTVTVFLANYWEQQYSDCGSDPANQWHEVSVWFDMTLGSPAAAAGLASAAVSPWHLDALANPGGDPGCAAANPMGIDSARKVSIPSGEITHAAFYGYVTSHYCEEQWFLNPLPNGPGDPQLPVNICAPEMLVACAQRTTHVLIDGTEVGSWNPRPYTYAVAGRVGGETPGSGPLPGTTLHQYAWWTAQDEANQMRVYTGVGVIPPYVLDLTPYKTLLTPGDHTIELRIDGGDDNWMTSGELLLG